MIELNRKVVENQIKAAKALASEAVLEGCRTTIERECNRWGLVPLEWFGNDQKKVDLVLQNNGKIYAEVTLKDEDGYIYDDLMDNKDTTISDVESVRCRYVITQVLVDYDTELQITFNISTPLREEDEWTLRQLGKVEKQYHNHSSVSENVVCATGFDF